MTHATDIQSIEKAKKKNQQKTPHKITMWMKLVIHVLGVIMLYERRTTLTVFIRDGCKISERGRVLRGLDRKLPTGVPG